MYILEHYDWFGPIRELDEIVKKLKEQYDGKDGVEFLGRYAPHNKKFHWTHIFKAKDYDTWVNRRPMDWYKRDYKVHTHGVVEIYT